MKIQIKLEEREIETSKLFDVTQYNGEGLYIVNDGITWSLVSVENGLVNTIPLKNKDILKQYREQATAECQKDLATSIEGKLNHIISLLSENNEPQNKSLSDIESITKLVAVAQKPELIKDK